MIYVFLFIRKKLFISAVSVCSFYSNRHDIVQLNEEKEKLNKKIHSKLNIRIGICTEEQNIEHFSGTIIKLSLFIMQSVL